MRTEKVVIVMPAYNAALTLKKTVDDIPAGCYEEIIVVDDGSDDDTIEIAQQLGLLVFKHSKNSGYGANQKTCYRMALERGADYIIMLHPDYQYDSRLVPVALQVLKAGICDVVLGNRVRTRKECLRGGMPVYKYLSNRFLTLIENIALGQNLGDFHSGFRAFRRKVLETISFDSDSDGFVFDTQFIIQAVYFGFTLGDIPMPVRYFKEASSISLRQSIYYGLQTLENLLIFHLHRLKLIHSPIFKQNNTQEPAS